MWVYLLDTTPLCEWNYIKQNLVELVAMKGQVQEIRGTKSEDVIPGVKNVLPELGNTNLEEKCSGNTSSQSDDDTDKELQRFAHLLIENCSGGNEQSDGTVEKELQKFAHLLIEETTDLYYRTKCSSEGITTSNPWGLKPFSNLRASENLTIANKKREHGFQDYENVEETKVIYENTISNYNENEHLHRKTKFRDIIGKTDNVGFRHRNDKNVTWQQQSTCRPVRQCDPFLWQPESNDLQENITLESVDKHHASTKVNPNASSSIKDNGNSSDYNYVLAEDDLLLPGILSSEENSACVDNDQMRIEKDDMSNDEDMPILRRETTFHRVDKITNVENLAQIHVNDAIETRAIGVGIKCVTYDKHFIGGHSESELEDSAESSVQVDKELGETKCGHASQKKYYQHVVGSDSNESKCLNTKISNQIIYKQNEPGNKQTSKHVKTHSVKVSLPRNVFECLAGIDNQVRNTSEESIIGQTFDTNDAKNNMRHGSEYELEHRFSQMGKETKKEQIHEQNVTGNTINKTLANEVECTAGSFGQSIRGLGNVADQQTYEKGASRGVMENSSSNKSKSIADSSSQLEESTNEQADANVEAQDLKINDYEYEMECLADSSTQVEENASEQAGECSDAHSRKGPVNELECIADKSNTFEEKKKISRQTAADETIQNTSRIESVDSENLADSSSRSEVNIGKQTCEHAQFLVRNNTANEDDCLEDSSSQMSKGQGDFACGSVYEAKSTKDHTRPSDNEVSLIQKIGALDLNNSSKGNELKSKPKQVSFMSGTRILLSRKNINDMNRASIKNVTRETTCIFSLKSYRKVRPCSSSADFLLYICSGSDVLKNPLTFETSDERLSGTFKSPDSDSSSIERRRLNKGLGCSLFVKKKLSMRKREDKNAIKGCDNSCNDSNKGDIYDELDHLNKRSIESVNAAKDHSTLKSEMDTDRPEQHSAVLQTEKVAKLVPENQPDNLLYGSSKYSSVDSITNKLHDIAVTGGENKSLGTSFNMKFLEFIGASSNPVKHENLEDNDGIAVDTRAKERKTYLDEDLDDDEIDGKRNYSVDEKLASTKYNKSFVVTDLKGEDFNLRYLQEHGLQDPIYFKDKAGLGLRVPSQNFQVSDVKACVGSRRMLDVMDVTTQKGMEMSMKEWVKYYENPEKDKLLNVISLEFSHTKLENYVESPSLVREVDWVDIAWPQHLKDCQTESTNAIDKMKYPKVQKYCLMSVKGCFTDFHVDFGGTSVWYHILHGEKVFWLIPPTPKNMATYENWVLSAKQGDVFLGDVINECQKVTLVAGSTFIIPSGWIHAVYTPKDSLVFGGNFLHSFNIDKQLTVAAIEEKTHVPGKFRYPFYAEIGWYVLERYVHCITGKTYLEKPKLSDELELMSGMSTSPGSPLYDDLKPDTPKLDLDIGNGTPKLSKRVAVTLTRIDSQSPRRQWSSDDDSMASEPPRSPPEASDGKRLYRKASSESSTSVPDSNADLKHSKTVPNVQKGKESSSVKKKMKSVFMTKYEKIGLTKLVQWIEDLPPSKKGIPKDLLNADAVMREMKRILEEHMDDSEKMAATGQPILVWTKATKKLIKMKQKAKLLGTSHVAKGTGKSSKGSGDRHRRVRCKKCEPCTRDDCRECNFCKDMKKYGGPGRMKQSCISRQCLAPCLANSATCKICNKDTRQKDPSGDETSTLMECGICWEIVHPNCLKGKENLEGEGVVNEDLPNSWICFKCNTDGKERHLKPRVFKGGWRPSPAASPSPVASPNPVVPLIGEDMVTEGKRVVSKQPADQPKVILSKFSSDPTAAPSPWQQTFEKSVSVKSETAVVKEGETSEADMEVEESKPVLKPVSQASIKKSVKRKSLATPGDKEKVQKKPKLSASVSPKGKGKSPKPTKPPTLSQSASGKKVMKLILDDINPPSLGPPILGRPKRENIGPVTTRINNPSTSYDFDECEFADNETITLPQLEKGKGAIAKGGKRQKTGKMFRSHVPEVHNPGGGGVGAAGANSLKLDLSGSPVNKFSLRKKPEDIGKVLLEHIEKRGLKVVPQKYVVRPIPVSPTKTYTEMVGGEKHPLPYIVWTNIFSYLSQADLARCLCVCRIWNRWCINPDLWKEINLSRNRIVQNHLMGIVRRQPESLILSSVIMTPKQLTWIVERIPLLKKLVLSKCSWATMSGLCTSACPLLTELDISWATGISDQFFEDLITPPVDRKPAVKNISRLHRLKILRIAGTEITDQAVELMTVHLSRLEVLDMSYCTRIKDQSVQSLANPKSATQETLKVLNLSGCRQLTDASLHKIKNFKHLSHLNMSACNRVSADSFRHFKMHGLVQFIH